jgi:glycosyltransferase involved in cell wall biosynthesis
MSQAKSGTKKVAVIVSAYNVESTIRRALESVGEPPNFEVEIVVIDDGSTDSTFLVCEEVSKEIPIRILRNTINCGAGFSRDFAISQIESNYIAILDADDFCINERIVKQFNYLEENPAIDLVSSQMIYFGPWGKDQRPTKYACDGKAIAKKLRNWKMPVAHGASMFRRDWYLSTKGYSHDLRQSEDLELFHKGVKDENFGIIDEPLLMCYTSSKTRTFNYVSKFALSRAKLILQDSQIRSFRKILVRAVVQNRLIGLIYSGFDYFKYFLSTIRR